ncbi:hypothetical protein DUNSADRAFT_5849 [Dunaliella salina]|uniref:Encoded protein n=1 Tax=Dunaliella salina TaxID=3046 RepID=A0ABQ7GPI8_DUNSA|nr:hypothetical protein DUNSADRAFT_5849 [Dunaliella salina]|eukprot:KAF5836518.1 hypothetical protein DUNSADRAFT_5849 [Dunaliella salina]
MQPPFTDHGHEYVDGGPVSYEKDSASRGSSSMPPPPPPFSYGPPYPHAYAPAAPDTWYRAGTLNPPYSMPNVKGRKPWAAGGPVGTGSIPFDAEAQVMHQFAEKQVRNGFMRKVGMITSYFDIEAVMLAFLTTCVAVGVLTLIASQVSHVNFHEVDDFNPG